MTVVTGGPSPENKQAKVHRVLGILQGMHMDLQKSILFPMTDLYTCNYNASDVLGKILKINLKTGGALLLDTWMDGLGMI